MAIDQLVGAGLAQREQQHRQRVAGEVVDVAGVAVAEDRRGHRAARLEDRQGPGQRRRHPSRACRAGPAPACRTTGRGSRTGRSARPSQQVGAVPAVLEDARGRSRRRRRGWRFHPTAARRSERATTAAPAAIRTGSMGNGTRSSGASRPEARSRIWPGERIKRLSNVPDPAPVSRGRRGIRDRPRRFLATAGPAGPARPRTRATRPARRSPGSRAAGRHRAGDRSGAGSRPLP